MRRALFISVTTASVAACSLFTDLGGFDEQKEVVPDSGSTPDVVTPDVGVADAGTQEDAFVTPDAALDGCPVATPSDGLVAFYPFDEGTGSVVTDCSPSGLNGVLLGAASSLKWVDGHNGASGKAIDLDGNGACFDLGAASILDFGGKSFTVGAWVKVRVFETDAGTARFVTSRESTSGQTRGWHLGSDNPTSAELDVIASDGGQREIASQIATNDWRHVAVVFDGSLKMYVNGVLANTSVGPHELAPAPNGVGRIGCKSVGSHVFDGAIDDLRIYSRALSQAEITSLAQP